MKITNISLTLLLLVSIPLVSHAHDEGWNLGSGTTVGAVLGGVIGYQIDRHDGAVVGSILGAIAGSSHHHAGAHHYQQTWFNRAEELRLRERVLQRIENETQRLSLSGDVLFEAGTSGLVNNSTALINSIALTLKRHNRTLVHITGYTDTEETDYANKVLSLGMADSVARQLVIQGIPRSRIQTMAGGNAPLGLGHTDEEGQLMQRRVDLLIEPVFDKLDRQ